MSIEKVELVIENGRAKIISSGDEPQSFEFSTIEEVRDMAITRSRMKKTTVYGEVNRDLIANIRIVHPGPHSGGNGDNSTTT